LSRFQQAANGINRATFTNRRPVVELIGIDRFLACLYFIRRSSTSLDGREV
jgi:hypothetical protein